MTKHTKVPPDRRGTRCDACRAWFRSSQRKPGQRCLFFVSTGCKGVVRSLKK